jgi:hypothetical protein
VLVDHPDARRDRVPGGTEGHGCPVDADLALVGTLHAVQDLHERGLARAVLADDGMHVALPHGKGDVAVGHDAGESFCDPLEFDGRSRGVDDGLLRTDGLDCGT